MYLSEVRVVQNWRVPELMSYPVCSRSSILGLKNITINDSEIQKVRNRHFIRQTEMLLIECIQEEALVIVELARKALVKGGLL
jgi:hypothetical protein